MREIKFRCQNSREEWFYFKLSELIIGVRIEGVSKNWGEYTGLKDKNDKEIYEGDILDFEDDRIVVYWADGFYPKHGMYDECEIIGNIYETPELLK
jgi:hypothetical protein